MITYERTQQPTAMPGQTYPWLGYQVSTGMVVLFSDKKVGTVLDPGNAKVKCGDQSKTMEESAYVPYIGPFTIQNIG
jgi:hypothetical protein